DGIGLVSAQWTGCGNSAGDKLKQGGGRGDVLHVGRRRSARNRVAAVAGDVVAVEIPDLVGASPAVDGVAPVAAIEAVVVRAALAFIGPASADDRVLVGASVEDVVPAASEDRVVPRVAKDIVIVSAADELVVARAAVKRVVPVIAVDPIGPA